MIHPVFFDQPRPPDKVFSILVSKPYPFDLSKPLLLIRDHRGRQVIPQDLFINKDLEYLKGGNLSRRYSTSVTKTKAATYEIKWIEDLVRNLWSLVKGIRMEYLPKRKWSGLDKRRAWVMVQDIDKQLYERRLMRNLEKFIGGREYGNDLMLLEQTI
ncbi:hypothetical protein Tco_0745124 [Tanacetum coccineum]